MPITCDYSECNSTEVNHLQYPDGSPAFVCDEHMRAMGFCAGCGGFYGGVESFSFIEPVGYCDDCKRVDDDSSDDDCSDWEEWAEREGLD
jgi:hypothetical protein